MSDNIDLKGLWKNQETVIPDVKELYGKVDGFKKKNLRTLIIANICLLLTTAFILFIWYYYQPEMMTTKIGIVLIILAMILYLIVYNQMIPLLSKADESINSTLYLQQLLQLKEKQRFLQSTIMNIYFILLSVGLCLYLFEYASRMTLTAAVLCYGVTLLWIVINWFFLRPRIIQKQRAKMDELVRKFEELNTQLKSNGFK